MPTDPAHPLPRQRHGVVVAVFTLGWGLSALVGRAPHPWDSGLSAVLFALILAVYLRHMHGGPDDR